MVDDEDTADAVYINLYTFKVHERIVSSPDNWNPPGQRLHAQIIITPRKLDPDFTTE